MPTSNSVDHSITRANIIEDALLHLGQHQAGETVSAEETTVCVRRLNGMVKRWTARGVKIWKTADAVLFLEDGKAVYEIGGTSPTDHAAYERVKDVAVKTELSAAALSGATTITVDSITGIADADTIGIVVDDGSIHWTTVSGAPSGSTVTLAASLPAAASVDAHVYAYTTDLPQPLQIVGVRRRSAAGQDIPVFMISRQEYQDLPNKTTEGKVTQVHYNQQLDNGYVYCWPTPDSSSDRLVFTAYLPLEDFDATGDNPDFPQEWYDALAYNLAVELAPMYGVIGQEKLELAAQAKAYLTEAEMWGEEDEPIRFQPDLRW